MLQFLERFHYLKQMFFSEDFQRDNRPWRPDLGNTLKGDCNFIINTCNFFSIKYRTNTMKHQRNLPQKWYNHWCNQFKVSLAFPCLFYAARNVLQYLQRPHFLNEIFFSGLSHWDFQSSWDSDLENRVAGRISPPSMRAIFLL